jgi:dihydrofolate reductase
LHPKITGIMACDPNGLIGKDSTLPWYYPEEFAHFRRIVYEQTIIMGVKTIESIPKDILDSCQVVVFSRRQQIPIPNVTFINSIEAFMELLPQVTSGHRKLFMIGGAEIAHLFLRSNLIAEFLLTRIHKAYEGNVFLDLSLFNGWSKSIMEESRDYTVYKLMNPEPMEA